MALGRRILNIFRYGIGPQALEKKRARKAEQRRQVFESGLWNSHDGLTQRKYQSYSDYVGHQVAKLDKIIHRLHETELADETHFRKDFEQCEDLKQAHSILCLGARLGTEVKALRNLGYFAIGIDLNPGKDNPYVLAGDFHELDFPDDCVDAVYTNSLDHAFDIEKVISEARRVLRPDGLFIADILKGYQEGFTPGKYESTHWQTQQDLIDVIVRVSGLTFIGKRDMGYLRRDYLSQIVFRKPVAAKVTSIHRKNRRGVKS